MSASKNESLVGNPFRASKGTNMTTVLLDIAIIVGASLLVVVTYYLGSRGQLMAALQEGFVRWYMADGIAGNLGWA